MTRLFNRLKTASNTNSGATLFTVMWRILKRSGHSPRRFIMGVAWRVLERILDLLPLVLAFIWLQLALETKPSAVGLSAENSSEWTSSIHAGMAWLFSLEGLIIALAALFLLQCLAAWQGQKQSFLGGYAILAGYRKGVLDQLHHLPLGVLAQYRSGQLADMMTDDVQRIEAIFTHLITELLTSLLLPVLVITGLLWLGAELSIALVIGFIPGVLVMYVTRQMFLTASAQKQDTQRNTSGLVVEFVTGLRTLRLFNRSQLWLSRLSKQFDRMTKESIGVEAWAAGPVVLFRLFIELGLVAVLWLMAEQLSQLAVLGQSVLVDQQSTTSANMPLAFESQIFLLLLLLLLAYRVVAPLLELAEHLTVLRFAVQSEHKINDLIDIPLLPEPDLAAIPADFSLSMRKVSFSYPMVRSSLSAETSISHRILSNISFDLKPGTMTAIVGLSGAGKSTLLHLLARFYDPDSGEVCLGGMPLPQLGSQCLYQHISMVLQQVQLFDGSVLDNVAMARPDASEQEVIAACKAAHCDEFIRQLPQGYYTAIGEGGMRLSGGERQRLSIARALLKDAPILLLDEATAALDMENQYLIQQALQYLIQGRTLVMVAHRLTTVQYADQILVLDQGCLVEQGQHEELILQKGLYQRLWQSQSGELS